MTVQLRPATHLKQRRNHNRQRPGSTCPPGRPYHGEQAFGPRAGARELGDQLSRPKKSPSVILAEAPPALEGIRARSGTPEATPMTVLHEDALLQAPKARPGSRPTPRQYFRKRWYPRTPPCGDPAYAVASHLGRRRDTGRADRNLQQLIACCADRSRAWLRDPSVASSAGLPPATAAGRTLVMGVGHRGPRHRSSAAEV